MSSRHPAAPTPRPARGARAALALALGIGCALGLGCEEERARSGGDAVAREGRVLLVGIDGATLRVANPLLEQGRLPNLERIARAGVYGPLRAHLPLASPRIWTSIATGKAPAKHGILNFAHDDDDGVKRLYLSVDRKVHALWNIASEAGLTVGVVNWWNTYPVEKVEGVLVSDHLIPMDFEGRQKMTGARVRDRGPIVFPPEWEPRVEALVAESGRVTAFEDPFADADAFPGWAGAERLSRRFENDEDVERIALALEAELRPDLLMVFLPGIDRICHVLWGALEPIAAYPKAPPSFSEEERRASANAIDRYYEFTDALIGRLLDRYDDDDLVLVVSDHGFEAGRGMGFLTGVHDSPNAADGVIFARGPGIAPATGGRRRVTVNDVTPTILAWLGLAVADDMDGRPVPFLHREVVARVATYDDRAIERLGTGPSGAEEEILENLRALGYLEPGAGE